MIIYNHVVNQCEDQKLILSQIFNTPIYKPNYSCIDIHAFQDLGVTLEKVILRSYPIEVIWGHLESIIPAHLRNYWYYRVFRGHMGSKFQAGVDSIRGHFRSMTRIIVQSHFSEGSSLSWYLGWTFRVLFWTFVVYFWIFNFGLSSDYRDCVTIRLSNFIKNSSNFHQNVTAGQTKILVLNQR